MKTTLSVYDFCNNERLQRNFTYDALTALFDYFEELEQDLGEELNFDPVAICCDFTEYENLKEACEAYLSPEDRFPNYANESEMLDFLQDLTRVIELPNCNRVVLEDF